MVFAPFTGMDNHQKCVTFASGLLMKEDVESYSWLFDCFKRAMGHDPKLIVTDQDPSMKISIESMFPNTRHRFCMWHITSKFTERIGANRSDLQEVVTRLSRLVWNEDIEPHEFEENWRALIDDFSLEENTWLEQMFKLRTFWIPAYFREILLAGRLRTTSISESQNSFFKKFSSRKLTLVELLMNFDSAMDKQRHEQQKLNFKSDTMKPTFKTPLQIERSAADVYTPTVFDDIQEEIHDAVFFCDIISSSEDGSIVSFQVKDGSKRVHKLHQRVSDSYISCTCNMFERMGIPCQHLFVVYKFLGLEEIPKRMVLSRWTKDAYQRVLWTDDEEATKQCAVIEEKKGLVNEMWSTIYSCVGHVDNDVDRLRSFIRTLKEQRTMFMGNVDADSNIVSDKVRMVESYAGISVPDEINVHPPSQAKNKGSGKRFRGGKEKAMEESHKQKRKCKRCNQYAGHNVRTCKAII